MKDSKRRDGKKKKEKRKKKEKFCWRKWKGKKKNYSKTRER